MTSPCQPGGGASCAACCGLYTAQPATRADLAALLKRRTQTFRGLTPTREAFAQSARALLADERSATSGRMVDAVGLCPLAGFLDRDGTLVGCLGHPRSTGGPDLRDCGSFGALTCEAFGCDTARDALSREERELVRDACGDWFLYGLVITDREFVRACLSAARAAAARELRLSSAAARRCLRPLFLLKEEAPRVFGERGKAVPTSAEERVLLAAGIPFGAEATDKVRALAREAVAALAALEPDVAG